MMTRPTSFALAALVAAAMIGTGLATPAVSQDQGQGPRDHFQMHGPDGQQGGRHMHDQGQRGQGKHGGPGMMGGMGPGGLLALVCSDKGSDRLEHLLLTLDQRTDPTAEQQPLYDTFKSAALDAQKDFATACADARPAKAAMQDPTAERPDLAQRMKARFDIEKAHVDAMGKVLPTFVAFYNSLTDDQKQALEPRRGDFQARMLDQHPHGHGPGMEQQAPAGAEPAPMNG